ncbi:hypothetical protein CS542_06700 [Pedobacter sp. IW39]|nr:hypothetical protein CS542_06700 [Pedobacter sp. IW39]
MTIDHSSFLYKEQGNKAIAVILSGTGNDGTKGAEAIRKSGGIVIVQDPATAAYKAMHWQQLLVQSQITYYLQRHA